MSGKFWIICLFLDFVMEEFIHVDAHYVMDTVYNLSNTKFTFYNELLFQSLLDKCNQ